MGVEGERGKPGCCSPNTSSCHKPLLLSHPLLRKLLILKGLEILQGLEGLRDAPLLPCPSFAVWLDERQIGRIAVPHRCLQRDSLFWGRKTGLVPPWEVLAAFPSGDFRSVPGHCAIVLLMWARGGETTRYHAAICISACGVWSV